MRSIILLIFFCLFSCSSHKEQNKKEIPKSPIISPLSLSDSSGPWNLGFSTPVTANDSLYPLIVYLHGGIGTTRTDKGNKAYEMFTFIQDEFPSFIASPSGNRNAPWWSQVGIQRIFTTVSIMQKQFPIDPQRIYLAGVSDGATGLFPIAIQPYTPFAGFIGAAGYPIIFGDKISKSLPKTIPLHLYISGNDRLYPTSNIIDYYKQLQRDSVSLTYKVVENAEHGFDYREDEKEYIINLLRSWKRTK